MERTETICLKDDRHKWKIFNATTLKLLAAFFMFLDHIHQMFVDKGAPIWLTMAGRLVFPVFLFAAAESFYYTHNKKKYLQRLLFASWGMTIFTVALQKIIPNPNIVLMNNAFSTFFVAGLYMLFWDYFTEGIRTRSWEKTGKAVLCFFIPVVCALPIYLVALLSFDQEIPASVIRLLTTVSLLVPNILTVEGGFAMVGLGVSFYIFRKYRWLQIVILFALSGITYVVNGSFQWLMCFAAIPMLLYNGKRGCGIKKFFYIFYPAHIGLLYILSTIL